jgi:hypothetical protein
VRDHSGSFQAAACGGVSSSRTRRGAAVTSEAREAARGRLDGRFAARTLGAPRRRTTAMDGVSRSQAGRYMADATSAASGG